MRGPPCRRVAQPSVSYAIRARCGTITLLVIALTPGVPAEGLHALAETLPKGSKALQALASRPVLTEPVAEILHKRVTGKARAATVRHITDPERLLEFWRKADLRPAVCANPHTPVDLLEKVMRGASSCPTAAALRAACNPSAPLETRKSELRFRNTAEILVAVSSPSALGVAHAHALVENNPWMLEDSIRWGARITRALLSRPKPPVELLDAVAKKPFELSRIPGARNHPLLAGRQVADMGVAELLAACHVAAELELLTRPEFTVEIAAEILEQPGIGPEPQVISGCLQRFGVAALLAADRLPHWAETRLAATSWLEPLAGHVGHLASPGWDEEANAKILSWHRQAREHLPTFVAAFSDPHETREALRTIYALVDGWGSDLADLIAVGMVL